MAGKPVDYMKILEEVEKRLPSVESRLADLEKAVASDGDWRTVEKPERLRFRMKQLSLDDKLSSLTLGKKKPGQVNILERIIKESELMPVSYLYKGARVARTVGRINIRSSRISLGYGTGFMVSPRLMMTNHHVLPDGEAARFSLVEMNYRETKSGVSTSSFFRLLPDVFFIADKALDFALVAIEEINEKGDQIVQYGFNRVLRESGKAVVGEHVNIVQHPSGEPKQIAVRQNKLIGIEGDFVHYLTDTQQGSSGSPVCNDNWDLVALHHAGKPARDENGNILLVDGSVWDGGGATQHLIRWDANEGVRISRIFSFLDKEVEKLDQSRRTIYQSIFDTVPGDGETEKNEEFRSLKDFSLIREADGSASMYIRIDMSGESSSGSGSSVYGGAQPVVDSGVSLSQFDNTPYYDGSSDREARDSYYKKIDLASDGDKLYEEFSDLLKESHSNVLSYRDARLNYLYPLVDRHEFGKLRNIYSGTILDPAEIISAELQIISRLGLDRQISGLSEERDEIIDRLEASQPFNCEHVVPQSWFDKNNPMRSDLHHLFTCEPACNSFRSNIPYWQFSPEDEAVRSQCGRREGDKFEPEHGKGAAARATLYFLLRYPGLMGDRFAELDADRLPILLDWHRRYKVDRYELHRNSTIFAVQGNRNPLIDYPELAEKINFVKGFA